MTAGRRARDHEPARCRRPASLPHSLPPPAAPLPPVTAAPGWRGRVGDAHRWHVPLAAPADGGRCARCVRGSWAGRLAGWRLSRCRSPPAHHRHLHLPHRAPCHLPHQPLVQPRIPPTHLPRQTRPTFGTSCARRRWCCCRGARCTAAPKTPPSSHPTCESPSPTPRQPTWRKACGAWEACCARAPPPLARAPTAAPWWRDPCSGRRLRPRSPCVP